ncbi:hypothetical protein MNBD_NITROSPINAE01-1316, partial [hydrothermal vent metagenome]
NDIDALMAANGPKEEPAETPAVESFDQNDIDALLAANAPKEEPAETPAVESFDQNDIDALLAANQTPAKQADDGVEQDDIDALLSATTVQKPEPEEKTPENEPDKLEETKTLFEEEDAEKAEGELISQDDIDADVFGETEPAAPKAEETVEEKVAAKDEIISQDDLDSLLAEAEGDVEKEAVAVAVEDETEEVESLDDLLQNEEDSSETLFEEEVQVSVEEGEITSFDEVLEGGDETQFEFPEEEGEIPGIPSGKSSGDEDELEGEETLLEEEPVEKAKKSIALPAFLTNILGAMSGILSKLPVSSLPKNLVTGGAVALLLAITGGGYWFFFGGKTQEPIEVAAVAVTEELQQPQPVENQDIQPEMSEAPATAEPVEEEIVDDGKARPVKIGVYLPVEFDAEAIRIMNVDVELTFETRAESDAIQDRMFYTAVTIEGLISGFFKERFYEDTIFAQDKLEEHISHSLNKKSEFKGLTGVKLATLKFK